MKIIGLFLGIWGGLSVALLMYLQSKVEIPQAETDLYRVGSATLSFFVAIPITALLAKKSG